MSTQELCRAEIEEITAHIALLQTAKAKTLCYVWVGIFAVAMMTAALTWWGHDCVPGLIFAAYLVYIWREAGPHLRWFDERITNWRSDLVRWREYEALRL